MVNPTLVSIVAVDGRDEGTLLALAASAARALETPFGTAILTSARERRVDLTATDDVPQAGESGVVASIAGHTVVVGTAALFDRLGLSLASLGDSPHRLQLRGQHVVFVAIDGRTAGFLGVIDATV